MSHSEKKGFAIFVVCVVLLLGVLIIRNERDDKSLTEDTLENKIYDNFIDRYNQAVDCGKEYNGIVEKMNKFNNSFLVDYFSKEYSITKNELMDKSRECEGLWLQVKLFLEDNRVTIEPRLIKEGKDYYEEISRMETQIKWFQETRQKLI